MMMNCTNKGCFKLQEPLLDLSDDKVYCGDCDKELTNISPFLKQQLKSSRQIRVGGSTSKAYTLACGLCKKECRPFIKNKSIYCSACQKEMPLSPSFKHMLLMKLKESSEA